MSVRQWIADALFYKSDKSLSFVLVFLLLLIFVIYPFFPPSGFGKVVIDVFTSLVLIASTFAIERRSWRWVAFALGGLTLVTRWATYARPTHDLFVATMLFSTLFIVFASIAILSRVFAEGPVTRHRIEGAVAVYLLAGLAFGSLYALVALVEPSSFELTPLDFEGDVRTVFDRLNGRFSYFSFITLTTVGYGDITPASALAKQIAVLEGLVGQLYPAILLARLVAMELTSRSE